VLEEALPAGIRVVSVNPAVKEGRVSLDLTIVARSAEDGLELLRVLEARRRVRQRLPVERCVAVRRRRVPLHDAVSAARSDAAPAALGGEPDARRGRGRRAGGRDAVCDGAGTPVTSDPRPFWRRRLLKPALALAALDAALVAAYTAPHLMRRSLESRRETLRVEVGRSRPPDAQRARDTISTTSGTPSASTMTSSATRLRRYASRRIEEIASELGLAASGAPTSPETSGAAGPVRHHAAGERATARSSPSSTGSSACRNSSRWTGSIRPARRSGPTGLDHAWRSSGRKWTSAMHSSRGVAAPAATSSCSPRPRS
jgi:hypothetical protein